MWTWFHVFVFWGTYDYQWKSKWENMDVDETCYDNKNSISVNMVSCVLCSWGERGGIPIDENAKWKSWMWMKDVLAYILQPQEPNLMWTWFHVFLCFGVGVIPIDENAKWESWMWMKNEVAYIHSSSTHNIHPLRGFKKVS